MNRYAISLLAGLAALSSASPAFSEDYSCEVMAIQGTAKATSGGATRTLKQGDLLKADDYLETDADSHVDLAYDSDWNNVTRIEENSKITIRSIYPTDLALRQGGVYATLKKLPTGSSFQVETPTAVASARGTEYRTVCSEEGKTEVFNFSESDVFVADIDAAGKIAETPSVLKKEQATRILQRGDKPVPRRMEAKEIQEIGERHKAIDLKVREVRAAGRVGKIQPVDRVVKEMAQRKAEGRPVDGEKRGKAFFGKETLRKPGTRPEGDGGKPRFGENGQKPPLSEGAKEHREEMREKRQEFREERKEDRRENRQEIREERAGAGEKKPFPPREPKGPQGQPGQPGNQVRQGEKKPQQPRQQEPKPAPRKRE